MIYSKILGTGSYLPEKILTNDDVAKIVDTSDQWIFERTGIRQRHVAAANETVTTMATKAVEQAISAANLNASDIDMIIAATCTHEQVFPSLASTLQASAEFKHIPCFDVQAACSGFIYALQCADSFIRSGTMQKIVVVGAETMTKILDWQDRTTCVLFGDGAGAVVLGADDSPGIIDVKTGADGSYQDILSLANSNIDISSSAPKRNAVQAANLIMHGSQVFKFAVRRLGEIATNMLNVNNVAFSDLDWLVPHQANIRIINATAEKIGLSPDKIVLTVDKHANTSAASIPLALDFAIRNKSIKRNDTMLLEAFGGGLTWGAALIKY